jgi:PAT family beta-lactamase induction signal transducer AmpG
MPLIGYQATFGLVALSLVAILLCFTMRLRESPGTTREASAESRLRVAVREIGAYSREAFRAFFGSRAAAVGVIVAVLPIGAMGISLSPINAKLAVDLGFKEADLASYNFVTGIIATVTCMAGGWLSDFVGRRRFIAVCVIGTSAMTLVLGWILQSNGWIMPLVKPGDAAVPPNLVWWFWAVSIAFSVFQGLMYGVRTALFMDICTPAVAATQFTAYMALLNVVISYSAVWQGKCVASMGYPVMLLIDALTGAICVFLLPLMKKAGDAMPKDAPHGSAS